MDKTRCLFFVILLFSFSLFTASCDKEEITETRKVTEQISQGAIVFDDSFCFSIQAGERRDRISWNYPDTLDQVNYSWLVYRADNSQGLSYQNLPILFFVEDGDSMPLLLEFSIDEELIRITARTEDYSTIDETTDFCLDFRLVAIPNN